MCKLCMTSACVELQEFQWEGFKDDQKFEQWNIEIDSIHIPLVLQYRGYRESAKSNWQLRPVKCGMISIQY